MNIKGFEDVGVKEYHLDAIDIVLLFCDSKIQDKKQVKEHMDNAVSAYVDGKGQHLNFIDSEKDYPCHRVIIFFKKGIDYTY